MKKILFLSLLFLFPFSSVQAEGIADQKSVLRQLFVDEIVFSKKDCARDRECFRAQLRSFFLKQMRAKRDAKKSCADLVSASRIEACKIEALLEASEHFVDFGDKLSKGRSKIWYEFRSISQIKDRLFGQKDFDVLSFEANEIFAWDKNNLYWREQSGVLLVPVFDDARMKARYKTIFIGNFFRVLGGDFIASSRGLYRITDLQKCEGNFDAKTLILSQKNTLQDKHGEHPFDRDISGAICPQG